MSGTTLEVVDPQGKAEENAVPTPHDETTTPQQFAFGDPVVDGVQCPSVEAGEINSDERLLGPVAELYDQYVRQTINEDQGVIPEDLAAGCWIAATDRQEGEAAKAGYEVAEAFGWEEDLDSTTV